MSVEIFVMTHKKFDVPKDPLYIPLQVGREGHEDLGYLCDNTGDNISSLNCCYSELTGIYWLWKNYHKADYIGVCHYRRYLVNENDRTYTAREYQELLQEYDMIVTKELELNCSYYEGYAANHHEKDLAATGEAIRELYPEYEETFWKTVRGNRTYFGNICVTSKKLFDTYASWLFSVFFEVQKRICIRDYDDYHKRVFGFISEILLLVFVRKNHLHVYESKVGMLCEKAETTEMKEQLADYFQKRQYLPAKEYFLKCLEKRPDVLMEASDINGELKLSMQVIATCEKEMQEEKTCVLNQWNDFGILMRHFGTLNDIVQRCHFERTTEKDLEYLKKYKASKSSIQIAAMLFYEEKEVERIVKKLY